MVKLFLFIFFIFNGTFAYAITGTVTVLEAPLFATPDEKSKVIQYYRKGETVFLHQMEVFEDRYQDENFVGIESVVIDKLDDPFLVNKDIYYPNQESTFFKTISRNGKEAYILKEHVLIDYKDSREFDRKVLDYDHTDYRLQDPLPRNYPFVPPKSYRGLTQFGLGQPNFESYPYKKDIVDTSFDISKEFNFMWTRSEEIDELRRFYFGAMAGFKFSTIRYLLTTQFARQENFNLYIGPLAAYDVYRSDKGALNIYTSLQYSLVDQMKISMIEEGDEIAEVRLYQSHLAFSHVLGVNYQHYKSFYKFDSVIGANVRTLLPRIYSATSNAENNRLWRSLDSSDSYTQGIMTEISFFIGIQNHY